MCFMKTLLPRYFVAASILIPCVWPSTGTADILGQIADLNTANAPVSFGGSLVDNVLVPPTGGSFLATYDAPSQNLGAFSIVIVPGPTLAGNAAALAAFNRAANAWAARISDPITVTINADLSPLGAGILGSTSSTLLQAGYSTIRNQVVADAADEPSNGIMASTPTEVQFGAFIPSGRTLNGFIVATKANLKAMGITVAGQEATV